MQPVIFFDWDDTLFPTTPLDDAIDFETFKSFGNRAHRVLRHAMRHGPTSIVTNSLEPWVHFSSRRYYPKDVEQTIKALDVFHAIDLPEGVRDPLHKQDTFLSCVCKYISPNTTALNLISIGDSNCERFALQNCGKILRDRGICQVYTKTIKLLDRPTPEQLIGQLDFITELIQKLANTPGDQDLIIEDTFTDCNK